IEIKAPVYKSGTEKLNENFTPQNVIWGTNIVIDSCQTRFRKFIQNFTIYEDETNELEPSEDGSNEPLYSKYLNEIHLIGDPVIDLNCMHLKNFDRDLHQQLITYPKEVLPIFDMIINEMYSARFPEDVLSKPIQ
ncbi:MAG: DNA replication licensing factor, mcm4 component, partial [Paramarteilia canceri]